MNTAFYTGVSGLMAFQEHMNVTAHNIANVSTAGYKSERANFSDLMYTEMNVRAGEEKKDGHGTRVGRVDLNLSQGQINMTGRELDFAITGNGFFALERDGEVRYTRNGAFGISPAGNKGYLVSLNDGAFVLDKAGRPIKLAINRELGGYDTDNIKEKIGIFEFSNPYGLEREENSSFKETELSGKPIDITGSAAYELRGASLERSGTELGNEMLNMIEAQRAYQINSKVVRTADELEELVNNLR